MSSTTTISNARSRRQTSDERSWLSKAGLALLGTEHTNQKFRVGAPPLQLLPLCNYELDDHELQNSNYDFIRKKIIPKVRKYCFDQKVVSKEVELYHRRIEGPAPSDPKADLTLYIDAIWDDATLDHVWRDCVQYARGLLINANLPYVKVEMLSWQLYCPKYMDSVESVHPFIHAWDTIVGDQVEAILRAEPKLQRPWRSIDVLRLGWSSSKSLNPIVISITVDWTLDPPDWVSAERKIRSILDQKNFQEVEIGFERGEIDMLTDPFASGVTFENEEWTFPEINVPYTIRPGCNIGGTTALFGVSGVPANNYGGTVGPLLLGTKDGKKEGIYALTSYHVARHWLPGWQLSTPDERKIRH